MSNYDLGGGLEAVHISTDYRNYEAARTSFFLFRVPDIDNIVKSTFKGDLDEAQNTDKIAGAAKNLELNVTKANVPHFKLAKLEYKRGNEVVSMASTPTFESGSITVDDIVGIDTKSILMAWQALAYNVHTRKGGRMVNYKKTAYLLEYTQDFELVRTWTLYGC